MNVIGLMSGTSADGIDAVVVEMSGAPPVLRWRIIAHRNIPYSAALRSEILACCDPRTGTVDRICTLDAAIGQAFAQAALAVTEAAGLPMTAIDLIGSHGQTIWHAPHGTPSATLQIGSAATIAETCGVPVVNNFRPRDIAAGGQGAPLVAAVDALLFSHPTHARAIQNIGGIANVTFLPAGGGPVLAFDTGPGNMLIDAVVQHLSGGKEQYDDDGQRAAQGQVQPELLAELLKHPFFMQKPPRTTGREAFGAAYCEQVLALAQTYGIANHDLVATLTALTAQSIAATYRTFLPSYPEEVIISGGGSRNTTLIQMLKQALTPAKVFTSNLYGLASEAKEALSFAILAYETWHGRPGNIPSATGASHAVILGSITPASQPLPLSKHYSRDGKQWTEERNPHSAMIDTLSTSELLQLINQEDALVAGAVAHELPQIAAAVDLIAGRLQIGGRLFYIGAGTSGRLGMLDATECQPTFNTAPELVQALIAGGDDALTNSVEGAEDDLEAGRQAINTYNIGSNDVVVGIAASGTTPYVVGALQAAHQVGAYTISLACNHPTPIASYADIAIAPIVGPEVVTGSTRMKAGTAQKLVLNMLSTAVMIRLGKVYGNLMVDLQAKNTKLRRRSLRIVVEATGLDLGEATQLLTACDGEVKTAIVVALAQTTPDNARRRLELAHGVVRAALQILPWG